MKISTGLFVLAGCVMTACSAQAAGDLPRYKLEIGQELVYESSSDFHYQNGSFKTKGTTTFWVAGLNPDGSWHILALQGAGGKGASGGAGTGARGTGGD